MFCVIWKLGLLETSIFTRDRNRAGRVLESVPSWFLRQVLINLYTDYTEIYNKLAVTRLVTLTLALYQVSAVFAASAIWELWRALFRFRLKKFLGSAFWTRLEVESSKKYLCGRSLGKYIVKRKIVKSLMDISIQYANLIVH